MDADLMHMMHTWGVDVTHWLQNAAPGSADGLLLASRVGDPGNAWLLFFPVAFVYRRAFGLALLRATVFAEWLNLVLKWALNGERPYWWSKIHTPEVVLQQFPLTCETGPGSPSGHAMVCTAVFATMALWLTQPPGVGTQGRPSTANRLWASAVWSCVAVVVALVSVSRLYISAHFPHQVVGGAAIGFALAALLHAKETAWKFTSSLYCSLAATSLLLGITTYSVLHWMDLDPGRSVHRATAGCNHRSWIHASTTPFYVLWRDSGAMVGLAIADLAPAPLKRFTGQRAVAQALLGVLAIYLVRSMPGLQVPYSTYVMSFLKAAAVPVVVASLVPRLIAPESGR